MAKAALVATPKDIKIKIMLPSKTPKAPGIKDGTAGCLNVKTLVLFSLWHSAEANKEREFFRF